MIEALIGVALLSGVLLKKESGEIIVSDFDRWDSLIKKYSNEYKVPWRWVKAVMIVESNLGRAKSVAWGLDHPLDFEKSKSSDGKSWGLMQVTLTSARELEPNTEIKDLNNPETSIRLGVKYLSKNLKYFGIKNREAVVRSYNGGRGYMNSDRGKSMTSEYYAKFLNALKMVMMQNQGDELEY